MEKMIKVINPLGLHARPAAKVVDCAARFTSDIRISYQNQEIDAKSIMGLLMLGAAKGTSVTFQVDGNDETAAMEELTDLFGRRFDEEE